MNKNAKIRRCEEIVLLFLFKRRVRQRLFRLIFSVKQTRSFRILHSSAVLKIRFKSSDTAFGISRTIDFIRTA